MTNTKCTIDCAKYNVKWNIEFWRKWNAIQRRLCWRIFAILTFSSPLTNFNTKIVNFALKLVLPVLPKGNTVNNI